MKHSNVHQLPVKHALLHRAYDKDGFLVANAATRITAIEGSEPRQYCLDLSTPGSRLDETVNVGVLTGTESELKRIQSSVIQISSGTADTQDGLFFGKLFLPDLRMVVSRHAKRPKWLIQCLNKDDRPWFNYAFCDQTAAEIIAAIEHYAFSN